MIVEEDNRTRVIVARGNMYLLNVNMCKNASVASFIMLSLSFDEHTIPFSQTDTGYPSLRDIINMD